MSDRAMNNRANAAFLRLAAVTEPPPCPKCGSTDTVIAPGSGPHAAREECAGCGRYRRLISTTEVVGDDDIRSLIDDGEST